MKTDIFLFVFLFCLCMIFVITIPIMEMYNGITFMNDIICTSIITIPTWLIVKSATSFLILILVYVNIVISTNTYYVLYSIYIFSIFWLILGSIIFWNDCKNLSPYFNTFIWIDLIFSYITVFNNLILCSK